MLCFCFYFCVFAFVCVCVCFLKIFVIQKVANIIHICQKKVYTIQILQMCTKFCQFYMSTIYIYIVSTINVYIEILWKCYDAYVSILYDSKSIYKKSEWEKLWYLCYNSFGLFNFTILLAAFFFVCECVCVCIKLSRFSTLFFVCPISTVSYYNKILTQQTDTMFSQLLRCWFLIIKY